MVISQKVQYAMRAVFELAKQEGAGPLTSAHIAAAQQVPRQFLNNILLQLRFAGIVDSARGQHGGYTLVRAPSNVSVGSVLRAVEGPTYSDRSARERTDPETPGGTLLRVSAKAHKAMMDVYDSTTFQDLLDAEASAPLREGLDYAI